MPFGLDLKTFIVAVIFVLFVWPFLASFVGGLMGKRNTASA